MAQAVRSAPPRRGDSDYGAGVGGAGKSRPHAGVLRRKRAVTMAEPVVISAVRTAIGTAYKGALVDTPPEDLALAVLHETVRRSGMDPGRIDDVVLAESLNGGGDLARYVALQCGMTTAPGLAVNRHCAASLAAVGVAAAGVASGMEDVAVAGGVHSSSFMPQLKRRVPGTADELQDWFPATHPETADAPGYDMS